MGFFTSYTILLLNHDDVINWKHFPRYWPFVWGINRGPVNSPHKGLWRGALMFSVISAWMNSWVNNGEAGDLRRNRTHYDFTVMIMLACTCGMFHPKSKLCIPNQNIIHYIHAKTDSSGLGVGSMMAAVNQLRSNMISYGRFIELISKHVILAMHDWLHSCVCVGILVRWYMCLRMCMKERFTCTVLYVDMHISYIVYACI